MTAWMYSALAALAAVGAEIWMKAHPNAGWPSWQLAPAMAMALVINFGIWGTLRTESLLGLTILFSLFTAGLRLAYTVAHHEPVAPAVWVAFTMIVIASLIKSLWR